jgi:N-acetylglucosaminyldiphosphoundecaprenol N-acetyl-beta-D-mannosaminyltransferase
MHGDLKYARIVGLRVNAISIAEATELVCAWGGSHESRMVCCANVHVAVTARDRTDLRDAMEKADLVTPDGMPLVWMLRRLGFPQQQRAYGPDLMLSVCERAEALNLGVAFFGSTREVLDSLIDSLKLRYPNLSIVSTISPPFRRLSADENVQVAKQINDAGASVIFVGLGAPRQELWMHEQKEAIAGVMIGVGAGFDFHAGTVRQAPRWLMRSGLEWLFRLIVEPRRLWRRYFTTIPRFILLALRQLAARPG